MIKLIEILDLSSCPPEDEFIPCDKCGVNPNQNCHYGEQNWTDYGYEFDCGAPNAEDLECPCKYTWCDSCKEKYGVKEE